MSDLAAKLRDMHALAADSCDPEFNRALLEAADEIERLSDALTQGEAAFNEAIEKMARLQADNERLRAALFIKRSKSLVTSRTKDAG